MNISVFGTGDVVKLPFENGKCDVVLHKLYSEVECHTDGSIAYFKCRK